jgi:hypothetical protein
MGVQRECLRDRRRTIFLLTGIATACVILISIAPFVIRW